MSMISILNSFASGITFSIGVCVGAWLARLAAKQGQALVQTDLREHAACVEDRLDKYVKHTAVIAAAALMYMDDMEHVKHLCASVKEYDERKGQDLGPAEGQ